jgi:putative transposase
MIYAATAAEVETRRKAFLRKWRLKCRAVADSLEEAGERLFAFTRLDPSQWKSARTPTPPLGECKHSPAGRRSSA